jgi:hypothetical protein
MEDFKEIGISGKSVTTILSGTEFAIVFAKSRKI